jgi:hypothetical protein
VDLYHARQHLWDLGGKLHPNDKTAKRRRGMPCRHVGAPARRTHANVFWTVRGTNVVIALRCSRYSRLFDDYWEHRRD